MHSLFLMEDIKVHLSPWRIEVTLYSLKPDNKTEVLITDYENAANVF